MHPIELRTSRLRLRELTLADGPAIWAIVSQQDGLFFQPGLVSEQGDVESWLEWVTMHAEAPARTYHRLGIELLDGGELIGSARADIESNHDRLASLGYALVEAHWGQGYATEAATAMLGFAFEQLGLHRIEALVETDNTRSLRVLEKLGLRMEGRLRERFRVDVEQRPDLGGAFSARVSLPEVSPVEDWRDALLYAITRDEWIKHDEAS